MRPTALGYVLGALALFGGLQAVAIVGLSDQGGQDALVPTVAAVTAVVLGIAGAGSKRLSLVASAAVALFVFLPQLAARLPGSSIGTPAVLLIAGAMLIGSAIVVARLRRQW